MVHHTHILALDHTRILAQTLMPPAKARSWIGKLVLHLIWISSEERIFVPLRVPEAGHEDVHVVFGHATVFNEVFDICVIVAHLSSPLDELLLHRREMLICLLTCGAIALDRSFG